MGVNLCDSSQCSRFLTKLRACERSNHLLSDWEQGFVAGLREKFNERDTMVDMGVSPWNPSTNQYNTLFEIAERVS